MNINEIKKTGALICALALVLPANIEAVQPKSRTGWIVPTWAFVTSAVGVGALYSHCKMRTLRKEKVRLRNLSESHLADKKNQKQFEILENYGKLESTFKVLDLAYYAEKAKPENFHSQTEFLDLIGEQELRKVLHSKADEIAKHPDGHVKADAIARHPDGQAGNKSPVCKSAGNERCLEAFRLMDEAHDLLKQKMDPLLKKKYPYHDQQYKLDDTIRKHHNRCASMLRALVVSGLVAVPFAIMKLRAHKNSK